MISLEFVWIIRFTSRRRVSLTLSSLTMRESTSWVSDEFYYFKRDNAEELFMLNMK